MGFFTDPVPHFLQVGSPRVDRSLLTLLLLSPSAHSSFSLLPLTPRQCFALSKIHFPRGSTALAAGPSWALKCVCGWEPAGNGWVWLCMAGYGPSLTWQGLPCTASAWAPAPRHHCPLQLSQLVQCLSQSCLFTMLRRLQRCAAFCFELRKSNHQLLESLVSYPCSLTTWGDQAVLGLCGWWSRDPYFLADKLYFFKISKPIILWVSPLTLTLFCYVFWVFSGGGPAAREQLLWLQTWWSLTRAIHSRGVSSQGPFTHGSRPPWGVCGVSFLASASWEICTNRTPSASLALWKPHCS